METDGARALKVDSAGIPRVIPEKCSGCGRCIAACRTHCITLEVAGFRKYASVYFPERCNSCGDCVQECPVQACIASDGSGHE